MKYKFFSLILLLSAACSSDEPSGLAAPEPADATDISGTSFVISWNAVSGALGYELDISTDDFTTFVTGYNSKKVIATTETVTGLSAGTTYKYRVRSFNETGVSPNSEEAEVTTTFLPVANINGVQFTPTSLTLTDTQVGLELRMKNATHDITFRLSGKEAGTYDLLGLLTLGRKASFETAMAWWTTGTETFYDISGSVAVSKSPDGKFSLTFSAKGESASGAISNITNGKLQNVITRVGVTQCSLATFSQTSGGQTRTGTFGYDGEGRLIQFASATDMWNFFWTGSRITRAIFITEYEWRDEVWTYQNNLLTKITGTTIGVMGDGPFEITYTYTGGKLTKAVREANLNEVPFTFSNTISYSGDNVSTVELTTSFFGDIIGTQTDTYSQFDAKNNFWQLLAKNTNNPLPIGFTESIGGEVLSKNNPGKMTTPGQTGPITTTFTYPAYSAAGYPTSLTYASTTNNYTATATYAGCN